MDLYVISSGSYCTVWMSRRLRDGLVVACKKFRDEPQSQLTVHTELCILERLQPHPHIVKYLHHQKDKDGYRLTLEYVENTLWIFLLKQNSQSNESVRLDMAHQLLTALEYCHSMMVLHRDIKPENILMTSGGCLKLADFNWSCFHSPSAKESNVCTIYYRSPELYRAQGREIPYGPYIDIWAAGCIFAQLFTQSEYPVFFFEEDEQVERHVLDERFVKSLCDQHELVEMCLAMHPLERASASEMLKFIDSVILN